MGVGPAAAIPAAVRATGLELDNIDLFEINEVKNHTTTLLSISTPYVLCLKILFWLVRHLRLSLFIVGTSWG